MKIDEIMRNRFKFRAWDKNYENEDGTFGAFWFMNDEFHFVDPLGTTECDIKNAPFYVEDLSESTRLKDKNGVDIYKGDILRLDEDGEILVVKYIAPSFWLVDTDGDRLFNAFPYFTERKIIGNVHQNEDLLK